MIGETLSHYRIMERLGRGGMGQVFLAEDLRLHRPVALKVLSDDTRSDAASRARLVREARAASALNHPGIAVIYEVNEVERDGAPLAFIAMEYVAGSTLAELRSRQDLDVDAVLDIAGQLADALAAAHARGVVHRDVKPSNVIVTEGRRVKVLDFGLAQYTPPVDEAASTWSRPAIEAAGSLAGTVAYMSPEQALGKELDARTDIFSFGIVLHELLAGDPPFRGANVVQVLDAILRADPPPLPASMTDPRRNELQRILRRMMAKDRGQRYPNLDEFRRDLDAVRSGGTLPEPLDCVPGSVAESPRFIETLPKRGYRFIGGVADPAEGNLVPPAAPPLPERRRWSRRRTLVFVSLAALAALAVWAAGRFWVGRPTPMPPPLRSSLLPPPGMSFVAHNVALSPSGRHLAFVAESADGVRSLWVRATSTTSAREVAGTNGARLPFWSPDERHIAFFADWKLKVVDLGGGNVRELADTPRPTGGAWNSADVILYAPEVNGPLYKVPADGGAPPVAATHVAAGEGPRGHRWPVFLPDGRRFLFAALSTTAPDQDAPELRVGSLDSPDSTRVEWAGARSVAFAVDRLWFVRAGTLYAQPFDSARAMITGGPVALTGQEVSGPPLFYPSGFSVAGNGALVFLSTADAATRLVWLDANGREPEPRVSLPDFSSPAISPDGRSLAGSCDGPGRGQQSICVHHFGRGVTTRLTDGPNDRSPAWSADGSEVAYSSATGVYRVPADHSSTPQLVSSHGLPTGWTRDGRILVFGIRRQAVVLDLVSMMTRATTTLGPGAEGQLSRTGAWLAYIRDGLVVQRFPEGAPRVQVTGPGASQPRWSADDRRLFYIGADKKLMVVDFEPRQGIVARPRIIAQTNIVGAGLAGFQYDVAPDGRFIVNSAGRSAPLTMITGWNALLER